MFDAFPYDEWSDQITTFDPRLFAVFGLPETPPAR